MAKMWLYSFQIRVYLLAPKHYERFYEVGESFECIESFWQHEDNDKITCIHLFQTAYQNDHEITLVGPMKKTLYDEEFLPQKPLRKLTKEEEKNLLDGKWL